MADFSIEIQGDHIVVTIPGTTFSAIYRRDASGMDRVGVTGSDLSAPISVRDFITRADELADEKARQLGWIV
jgi:hypothetical protein